MSIKIEQIQKIYKLVPLGILGQTLVAIIVFLILLSLVPDTALYVWGSTSLAILILRSISVYSFKYYFHNPISKKEIFQWFEYYCFLLLDSGMVWATSIYFVDYYIQEQSGRHFDPELVDKFLK